jgi:hypothetical protein
LPYFIFLSTHRFHQDPRQASTPQKKTSLATPKNFAELCGPEERWWEERRIVEEKEGEEEEKEKKGESQVISWKSQTCPGGNLSSARETRLSPPHALSPLSEQTMTS